MNIISLRNYHNKNINYHSISSNIIEYDKNSHNHNRMVVQFQHPYQHYQIIDEKCFLFHDIHQF